MRAPRISFATVVGNQLSSRTSVDGYACRRRRSLHFRNRQTLAHSSVSRRPQPEIEVALVGLAVARNRVRLIDREKGRDVAVAREHRADVVQLHFAAPFLGPHAEADVAAGGRQKSIFKLGPVRVPGLERLQELERGAWRRRRASRREIVVRSPCVNHMPQTDDTSLAFPFAVSVRADKGNGWCRSSSSLVRYGAACLRAHCR